jgi:hypothetical protein
MIGSKRRRSLLNGQDSSGAGTSATFTLRDAISEVHSEADISHIADPAAFSSRSGSASGQPTRPQKESSP